MCLKLCKSIFLTKVLFSQKLVCIYENHIWQQIVCLNTTATLGSSNLVFQVMN